MSLKPVLTIFAPSPSLVPFPCTQNLFFPASPPILPCISKRPTKLDYGCLYDHGCEIIYWSMGKVSVNTGLRKMTPSSSSHQLSIAPKLGLEPHEAQASSAMEW